MLEESVPSFHNGERKLSARRHPISRTRNDDLQRGWRYLAGKPQTSTHWSPPISWAIEDGFSQVKATAEDFVRIADLCMQERKDLGGNHRAVRPLRTRNLSSFMQATIEIFSSRARFEYLKIYYFRKFRGPAEMLALPVQMTSLAKDLHTCPLSVEMAGMS